jgi:hypothetical protein
MTQNRSSSDSLFLFHNFNLNPRGGPETAPGRRYQAHITNK